MKYDDGVEIIVGSVAAIDLELVRLNGDLIFPRWSHLIGFDKLDVGIRVIDPDRGRPSVLTSLPPGQWSVPGLSAELAANATDYEKLTALGAELKAAQAEKADLEERWLTVAAELDA